MDTYVEKMAAFIELNAAELGRSLVVVDLGRGADVRFDWKRGWGVELDRAPFNASRRGVSDIRTSA